MLGSDCLEVNIHGISHHTSLLISNNGEGSTAEVFTSICRDDDNKFKDNVRAWANVMCNSIEEFNKMCYDVTFLDNLNDIIVKDFDKKKLLENANALIIGIFNDGSNSVCKKIVPIVYDKLEIFNNLKPNQILTDEGTILTLNFDVKNPNFSVKRTSDHPSVKGLYDEMRIDSIKISEKYDTYYGWQLNFDVVVTKIEEMFTYRPRVGIGVKIEDLNNFVLHNFYVNSPSDFIVKKGDTTSIIFSTTNYNQGQENKIYIQDYVY